AASSEQPINSEEPVSSEEAVTSEEPITSEEAVTSEEPATNETTSEQPISELPGADQLVTDEAVEVLPEDVEGEAAPLPDSAKETDTTTTDQGTDQGTTDEGADQAETEVTTTEVITT